MKIFIQGRKDGYNTLYPKPTPAEFYQFASDIQRIDAQNNSQYYGKCLYSIAFNGIGCIFTKYIIGYDTLRSYLGNIGISFFLPSNKKMSGADIKTLLDELINIYTTYCPDFKINNQKQEDWLLFQSAADNYDSKVETISSGEKFQYGHKDAAYIFYNDASEIEKYIDAPYQSEYKEYKQIFFLENQSQLLLEVIKHDQTANLTEIIKWDNPSFTLRDYHRQVTNGISIKIFANGIEKKIGEKIKKKDRITINFSRKYHEVNDVPEGNLIDPHIQKYLKIDEIENSLYVVEVPELNKSKLNVEISLYNSKGDSISDATITCKGKYYGTIPVNQNTLGFGFIGEQQKEEWTIAAQAGSLIGEKTIIPERDGTSLVTLTLREVKIIKLQIQDEKGILIPNKSKDLTFYDDEIRQKHTEPINVSDYQPRSVTFTPKDVVGDAYKVKLQKQDDKQSGHGGSGNKEPEKPLFLKILLGLSVACILAIGVYFSVDMFWRGTCPEVNNSAEASQEETIKSELSPGEIKSYVEGDSLFLEELNTYKDEWAKLKNTKDSVEYREYEGFIDKAIKKREAITNRDFAYFNDNKNEVKFSEPQQSFKKAVLKIKKDQYVKVKDNLGDVSMLTLTQIADSINKILTPSIKTNSTTEKINTQPKKEDTNQNKKKSNQDPPLTTEEIEIIQYLEGDKFNFQILEKYDKSNTSQKLKPSIKLALKFWSLDGLKPNTYITYFKKVNNDDYLKNNKKLTSFLEDKNQKKTDNTYPSSITGFKTLTLSKFIEKVK